MAGLGLGTMALVSSKVRTFQEGYQLGGAVVLPILLLVVEQVTGVLYFSLPVVAGVCGGLGEDLGVDPISCDWESFSPPWPPGSSRWSSPSLPPGGSFPRANEGPFGAPHWRTEPTDSENGGRNIPRSVMMAVISSAGVTSKAGFHAVAPSGANFIP